jgi:hypothetical protein
MKQTNKAILLTFLGLIIFYITKAGKKMTSVKFSKFKPNEALKLAMLESALINAGLTGNVLNYALSQLLFETGRFTSRSQVAVLNNNYSGIKFINKPYQKAERGSPVPVGERYNNSNNPLNFYAKFKDADAWAKDFVRILSFGAKPVNATSITDYAQRLANNNYYDTKKTNAVKNYTNGLKSYFDMFI